MTTLCFIEGIDGTGKTTTIHLLQKMLVEQGYSCGVINNDTPEEYRILMKIERRKNINSSPFAKCCYRFTRLYLALLIRLQEQNDFLLCDRGIVHFLSRSTMDGIEEMVIRSYILEFQSIIENFPSRTVLLDLEVDAAYQRNLLRPTSTEHDLDTSFLNQYRTHLNRHFANTSITEKQLTIHVAGLTKEQVVRRVFGYL